MLAEVCHTVVTDVVQVPASAANEPTFGRAHVEEFGECVGRR